MLLIITIIVLASAASAVAGFLLGGYFDFESLWVGVLPIVFLLVPFVAALVVAMTVAGPLAVCAAAFASFLFGFMSRGSL